MGGYSNRGILCSVDARVQSLVLVSESGMYDLVMRCAQRHSEPVTAHGSLRNRSKTGLK